MKRFYFALTNKCNRRCKWCSCFSRPHKTTFLEFDIIKSYIDSAESAFEIQLEGGEPLLHPNFFDIIKYAVDKGNCNKVILTTNFALVTDIREFLDKINLPNLNGFLLKPSINYDLYKEGGDDYFSKLASIKDIIKDYPKFELKYNVRLDKSEEDEPILKGIKEYNMDSDCNIFNYQRYGYASKNEDFDLPFIIDNPVDFYLISPDGENFGTDLIARSEHMRIMR